MTHPPPDLSTRAGRRAYRHELRMVAVRPRRVGLTLLAAAMLLLALPLAGVHSLLGWSPRFLAIAATVLAIPFLVAAQRLRARYRAHRLGGGAPHTPSR